MRVNFSYKHTFKFVSSNLSQEGPKGCYLIEFNQKKNKSKLSCEKQQFNL